MELMRVKINNEWVEIPAIVGPKGDTYELTEADRQTIAAGTMVYVYAAKAQADRAETLVQSFNNLSISVTGLPAGSPPTVQHTYNQDNVLIGLRFGIPRGADGDPTTLIDDTAGAGDTGKTWSADKLSSYLENAVQTAVNNYLNAHPELLSN